MITYPKFVTINSLQLILSLLICTRLYFLKKITNTQISWEPWEHTFSRRVGRGFRTEIILHSTEFGRSELSKKLGPRYDYKVLNVDYEVLKNQKPQQIIDDIKKNQGHIQNFEQWVQQVPEIYHVNQLVLCIYVETLVNNKKTNILEIHHMNHVIRCTFGKMSSGVKHRAEGVALDKIVVIMANRILDKRGELLN